MEILKSEVIDLRYDLREVIFGHFYDKKFNFGYIYEYLTASFNFLNENMLNNTEYLSIWPPGGHIVTSMTSERSKFQSVNFCIMGV